MLLQLTNCKDRILATASCLICILHRNVVQGHATRPGWVPGGCPERRPGRQHRGRSATAPPHGCARQRSTVGPANTKLRPCRPFVVAGGGIRVALDSAHTGGRPTTVPRRRAAAPELHRWLGPRRGPPPAYPGGVVATASGPPQGLRAIDSYARVVHTFACHTALLPRFPGGGSLSKTLAPPDARWGPSGSARTTGKRPIWIRRRRRGQSFGRRRCSSPSSTGVPSCSTRCVCNPRPDTTSRFIFDLNLNAVASLTYCRHVSRRASKTRWRRRSARIRTSLTDCRRPAPLIGLTPSQASRLPGRRRSADEGGPQSSDARWAARKYTIATSTEARLENSDFISPGIAETS